MTDLGMQKLIHLDSPRENYRCDGAVVWCYDSRFETVLRKLLKRRRVVYADHIRLAGGARCLADPEHESDQEFVLDHIRKSMRLHGTQRVLLMVHSDCGAYGGLGAFGSDEQAEARHHQAALQRAAACVREAIPGLAVECYFVNFEGVWVVEAASSVAANL